ncbi:LysM peptidoglycan-binding domain-containing protein [Zhihengliuella sp.]|uniref:LysM peptidoglycan-binding domain-containing protein n=1 Tax=Zhihengliuella sp. TaxID=1954483 RepID=UPI002810B8AE|nr:LysM peptidoglycan-binding domain-containing protein [Zhihengliuella sp.]
MPQPHAASAPRAATSRSNRSRIASGTLAAATLPAVVLTGFGAAAPAVAAPSPAQAPVAPKAATPANIAAAQQRIAASLVASQVPARLVPAGPVAAAKSSTVTVKPGDTLSHIAARAGVSLSSLLEANGLKASSVIFPGQKIKLGGSSSATSAAKPASPAATTAYAVKPGDTLGGIAVRHDMSLSRLLRLNSGLSKSSIIYPGQKLTVAGGSSSTTSTTTTTAAASSGASTGSYTVASGDTLGGIAIRHDMSLSRLLRLNGLSASDTIFPGQKLTVAGGSSSTTSTTTTTAAASSGASTGSYTVASGDTLGGIAIRHDMSLSRLLRLNGLSASDTIFPGQKLTVAGGSSSTTSTNTSSTSAPTAPRTHTVASGETLSGIAGTYSVGLSKLLEANNLSKTSVIRPGQKLNVPGGATTTASSQLVPSTFLHYRYPEATVRSANENKAILLSRDLPSRAEMRSKIVATAQSLGVDPSLALAHAYQESGFSPSAVSPANAIGAMQVIPTSGEWASQLVGRPLDLLDPDDNVVAGVAIIAALQRTSASMEEGIASYYQGQGSVRRNGMYDDTKSYVKSVKSHMANF